jgi:hypothetical protein
MAAYFGDGDAAIRELSAALHLMPFEPLRHLSFIGMGVRSLCRGPIRSGEFMGTKRSKGFPGLLLGAKNRDGRSGADRRAGRSSSHGPSADAARSRSHYRGGQTGMAVHASLYVPSGRRSRNRRPTASMSRRSVDLFFIVDLSNEPCTASWRLLLRGNADDEMS